jgi:hypothetical protein
MSLVERNLPLQPILKQLLLAGPPATATLLAFWKFLQQANKIEKDDAVIEIKDRLDEMVEGQGKVKREELVRSMFTEPKSLKNIFRVVTDSPNFFKTVLIKINEIVNFELFVSSNQFLKKKWDFIHQVYDLEKIMKPKTNYLEYPFKQIKQEEKSKL